MKTMKKPAQIAGTPDTKGGLMPPWMMLCLELFFWLSVALSVGGLAAALAGFL